MASHVLSTGRMRGQPCDKVGVEPLTKSDLWPVDTLERCLDECGNMQPGKGSGVRDRWYVQLRQPHRVGAMVTNMPSQASSNKRCQG